jgi:hypothetical protein
MVRYGGVVGDHETDDVERKEIIATPSLVTKRTFNAESCLLCYLCPFN